MDPTINFPETQQTLSYSYRPAGATLREFHISDKFVRVCLGPLGSGKTTACCAEIMRRSREQLPNAHKIRRSRWLVVRSTLPELLTTTIPSWRESFGPHFGKTNNSPPITHFVRFNLPDGTRVEADVIFMGLDGPDAPDKIRGAELTGAWVNECKDVSKGVLDMLTGRVGRFPPRRKSQGEPGPTWFGIIADTNMPDEGHWLHHLAEVERPDIWGFYRQPGGVLKLDGEWVMNEVAENLPNLPPNYYRNQLGGKSDDYIKVYLGAEYGYVREGKPVYHEFSDTAHVADLEPIPGFPLHIGIDFGLTPAAVIAQMDALGRIYILDEMCLQDAGAANLREQLSRRLALQYPGHKVATMTGDPGGNVKSQNDEKTAMSILNANGFQCKPAENNRFGYRRDAVARTLTRMIDGKPGVLINRTCLVLRAGLSGKYHYKKVGVVSTATATGDIIYNSEPAKNFESHICEAMQYLCLGLGEGRAMLQPEGSTRHEARKPGVVFGGFRGRRTRQGFNNRPRSMMR